MYVSYKPEGTEIKYIENYRCGTDGARCHSDQSPESLQRPRQQDAADQVAQMRRLSLTHGPVLSVSPALAAADHGSRVHHRTTSLHLSPSLPFMHRGH